MTASPIHRVIVKSDRQGEIAFDERLKRFSIADYHRLAELGFIKPEDNVELLNGWIVHNMPANPPHKNCMRRLIAVLPPLIPKSLLIDFQAPVVIGRSEPEPDVSVTIGPASRYDDRIATAEEIVWVVEASDWTLATDRREKCEIYASAGIPYYWIINLVDHVIEVYSEPQSGKVPNYKTRQVYQPGDRLPLVLKDKAVAKVFVNDIMP